jgi:hypothetical protein
LVDVSARLDAVEELHVRYGYWALRREGCGRLVIGRYRRAGLKLKLTYGLARLALELEPSPEDPPVLMGVVEADG